MIINENQQLIEKRLQAHLQPSFLNIIDESDQHVGHAGHQGGGRHFAIEIKAASLDGLPRVSAHRKIYQALADLMPLRIHALRIIILK